MHRALCLQSYGPNHPYVLKLNPVIHTDVLKYVLFFSLTDKIVIFQVIFALSNSSIFLYFVQNDKGEFKHTRVLSASFFFFFNKAETFS